MNGDDELGQTVRFREFVQSRDEIRARIHQIELEQARLSSSLMHVPQQIADLTRVVSELSQQVAQLTQRKRDGDGEQDHAALALHRALDSIQRGGGSGSLERYLMYGLIVGATWMAARFFMGG